MVKQKIKVITGKIGLDDHYRGIISVTEALRNAGMEVVYLGAGQRFDVVIKAIMQEDADVVGLSFLCGGHVEIMRRFMNKLKENNLDHVLVVVGGVIPDDDIPKLKELGVSEVFLPGAPLKEISDYVAQNAAG
ncbi:MAG: cobalamin-dependent protein [Thermodesulfobacteriota bacterium]|nr:cobalamin-dependent protein [Thermodesulfobacteriota bacterium]